MKLLSIISVQKLCGKVDKDLGCLFADFRPDEMLKYGDIAQGSHHFCTLEIGHVVEHDAEENSTFVAECQAQII